MNQSNESNLNNLNNMIQNPSQTPVSDMSNVKIQNFQTNNTINQISNSQQNDAENLTTNGLSDELNINLNDNKFINTNNGFNGTRLEGMNVEGNYNIEKTDYREDPKVKENLSNIEKKSIPITKELKMVIVISLVLFVFILIMPYIFDLFR